MHRPDQPDPSIDRGHGQLAAAASLLGAAPAVGTAAAVRRYRARLSAARHRNLSGRDRACRERTRRARPARPASAPRPRLPHLPARRGDDARKIGIALPDGAMISANILPDQRRPPFWGGPWMTTLLFAVISVTLLGLWAARALTAPLSSFAKAAESFSLNGAAAPLPERGPEEIRSVAQGAQPHARAHHRPDRRPHQDAGRDQPRSAHADHADAAALRIHRGRGPSPPHARAISTRCGRCWNRCCPSCATTAGSKR